MSDADGRITEQSVLGVFDEIGDTGEPLTTREVADALGCSRRVAYDRLERLAERDIVNSKRIGARARAWWQPLPETEQTGTDACAEDGTSEQRSIDGSVLADVFETCPTSIVVLESSGDISFANERAVELLGLELTETTDRMHVHTAVNIHDSEGASFADHPVVRTFETGEPLYGFEHWVEAPDGSERWLRGNAAPVKNNGTVERVVVGFVDATALKEREEKLTSDERRRLVLSSEELFRPFLEVTDDAFRIDVDDTVTLQDETVLKYVTATHLTPKATKTVFEDELGALDVRLIRSAGDQCSLEVQMEAPTLTLAVKEHGGEVVSLVRNQSGDEPALLVELPGNIDPREVIQSARRVYPDIELESQKLQYSPRLLYDIVKDELTERKFAVLQMAYHGGYFETPRKSDGDVLANRLGITRQTFNQHLRGAEQTVFTQLFESSGKERR